MTVEQRKRLEQLRHDHEMGKLYDWEYEEYLDLEFLSKEEQGEKL